MAVDRYFLADCGGTLCVVWESSDSLTPELIRHYWPVQSSPGVACRTRDFLSFYDVEAEAIGSMRLRRSMPGEFLVQLSNDERFGRNCFLTLLHGSKTVSMNVERVPFPAPKTSLETKYEDGSWLVRLGGRWEVRS